VRAAVSWRRLLPGTLAGRRRALWRAVRAADFAVLAAQQAGVATGRLDELCAQLRRAAADTGQGLTAGRATRGPRSRRRPLFAAAAKLVTAAGLIEDAAAGAVRGQQAQAAEMAGPSPLPDAVPSPALAAIAALIEQAAADAAGRRSPEHSGDAARRDW
jgi:hypothetical protein